MTKAPDKIERAFWKFHKENPIVYDKLVGLARRMTERGKSHYGVKALFEVARYHLHIETLGDEFKLNNNYTALYARLIMEKEDDLDGFFYVRKRRATGRQVRDPDINWRDDALAYGETHGD